MNVITGKYTRIPRDEWQKQIRTAVILMPEDWAIIKKSYYQMCIQMDCAQPMDVLDGVFETLKKANQQMGNN